MFWGITRADARFIGKEDKIGANVIA